MNIVYLMRFWPVYGGGETVTVTLANKLAENGHNVTVIYLWETAFAAPPFIDSRVKQIKIEGIKKYGLYSIGIFALFAMRAFLYRFIKSGKTDIVINQWWPPKLVYGITRKTGTKQINCRHCAIMPPDKIKTKKHKLLFFVFRKNFHAALKRIWRIKLSPSYKYSDRYVVLCNAFVQDCKNLFRSNNEDGKIRAIPNPLRYTTFMPVEELRHKQNELLFVGRMDEPQKKISRIIRIWRKLREKDGIGGWKLILVGDGPDLERTKRLAESLGCRDVYFEGFREPLEYYRRAAVFLMTSQTEGWGMTLVEAQQNGCVPVVMDTFASLHEIIVHGKNGMIVKDDDIDGFADTCETLMKDRAYRMELAENGLETSRCFGVEHIVGQWEALFEELRGDRPR